MEDAIAWTFLTLIGLAIVALLCWVVDSALRKDNELSQHALMFIALFAVIVGVVWALNVVAS